MAVIKAPASLMSHAWNYIKFSQWNIRSTHNRIIPSFVSIFLLWKMFERFYLSVDWDLLLLSKSRVTQCGSHHGILMFSILLQKNKTKNKNKQKNKQKKTNTSISHWAASVVMIHFTVMTPKAVGYLWFLRERNPHVWPNNLIYLTEPFVHW